MGGKRQGSYPKNSNNNSRRNVIALIAVCVVAIIVGVIIYFAINSTNAKDKIASTSLPASNSASSLPVPTSSEAASPVSEPEPEPEPEPVAPTLHFTQQELDRLNGTLDAWAALSEEGEENGHTVAVYFKDIESGLEYVYKGEQKFLIASLNKTPYAQYLYQLADAGDLDTSEIIYVTPAMIDPARENSGRLKNDETIPRNFTVEELIYEMLRYSDTAALRILMQHYELEGYLQFSDTLALNFPEDVRNLTNARITALDAGVYLDALYNYMQTDGHSANLKAHMMGTRNIMIRSRDKATPIARKYGWDINAYHDMAVVYTPRPYLLAILTDKSAGTQKETAMFATIAGMFEEIMQDKWAEANAAG